MAVANAFIAGVNKAGTTALFEMLASHRDVCGSARKETHYFEPLRYGQPLRPLAEYERYFSHHAREPVVLEASPAYFYGGKTVATAIRELSPEARVVVILREPGSRAFSWWRMCRSRMLVDRDLTFLEYLERCVELGTRPDHEQPLWPWTGLTGGLYSPHLPSWQLIFDEALLVDYHENLRADVEGCYRRIAAHLGSACDPPSTSLTANAATDIRNPGLHRLALRVNRKVEASWGRHPGVKRAARTAYYRLNARQAAGAMPEAARRWLDDYYRDDIAELRRLVASPHAPEWLAP